MAQVDQREPVELAVGSQLRGSLSAQPSIIRWKRNLELKASDKTSGMHYQKREFADELTI